jgi:hypothetical protein
MTDGVVMALRRLIRMERDNKDGSKAKQNNKTQQTTRTDCVAVALPVQQVDQEAIEPQRLTGTDKHRQEETQQQGRAYNKN